MKKILLVFTVLALVSSQSNAGILSSVVTSDWPTKDTKKYKIEAYGFDVRIYESTPSDNKNVRCVFAAGNQNSTGVACYEVEK